MTTRAHAAPALCTTNVFARAFTIRTLSLTMGTTVRVRTQNLSAGADPVLHLVGPSGAEVIMSDDYAPPDRNSRIDYPVPSSGTYTVIVRAFTTSSYGTADLEFCTDSCPSWTALAVGSSVGGTFVEVPPVPIYQTAEINAALGGNTDTVLLAMSAPGATSILDWDDDGGVARMSGVVERPGFPHAGIHWLMVGGYNGDGLTHVYANDSWTDTDGDYLGAALEACLGTCDSATTNPGCAGKSGWLLRDSDRDGLDDFIEVMGGWETPGLLDADKFPAWGADPRRKDIFLELDYRALPYALSDPPAAPSAGCTTETCWPNSLVGTPMTGAIAKSISDRFEKPSTSVSLQNLAQLDGAGVHIDIGRDCPNNPLVCGNWGGGGQAVLSPTMDSRRLLTFRYAILFPGGGQASGVPGSQFTAGMGSWGDPTTTIPEQRAQAVTHELGHTLGLEHWGHHTWGKLNCKPNYQSLMNYAFAWVTPTVPHEFARGTRFGVTLNSAGVAENAFAPNDATSYAAPKYSFPIATVTGWVDFNRDGTLFSGGPLRAGLISSNDECGLPTEQDDVVEFEGGFSDVTPALTGSPGRLNAYYVNAAGTAVRHNTAVHYGPTNGGGCWQVGAYGGGHPGETCHIWGVASALPGLIGTINGVAAYNWQGTQVVVAHNTVGDIYMYTPHIPGSWIGPALVTSGTVGNSEVSLSAMYVDPAVYGVSEMLGIFYLRGSLTPRHEWHSTTDLGTFNYRSAVLATGGVPILGRFTSSVAVWPARTATGFAVRSDLGYACGAFPVFVGGGTDPDRLKVYCYNKATDYWIDDSGTDMSANVARRPAIAFHTVRQSTGTSDADASMAAPAACIDGVCGQFYVVGKNNNAERRAWWRLSGLVSSGTSPSAVMFPLAPGFYHAWQSLSFAGAALYEDADLSALKGLLTYQHGSVAPWRLYGLGMADGTYRLDLNGGDDFQVMERGICLGLHGWDISRCGGPNVFGY